MSKLPKIHPSHIQEDDSTKKLASLLPRDKFLLREETGKDYGVDRIIEVIDTDSVTNIRSHVQIKSIKNCFADKNGIFKFSVPIKTIYYLSNSINSLFLIHSIDEDIIYWQWNSIILKQLESKKNQEDQDTFTYSFCSVFNDENINLIHQKLIQDNFYTKKFESLTASLDKNIISNIWSEKNYQELLELFFDENYETLIGILKKTSDKSLGKISLLALCYFKLFMYNEALKTILESENKYPENIHLQKIKSCIFCEKGILEQNKKLIQNAKNIHEKIMVNQSWDWLDYYNYGNMESGLNNLESAIKNYQESIRLAPNEETVWKNLGQVYYNQGNYESALNHFNTALELNPNLIEAIISKATLLGNIKKQYKAAIKLLDKALELPFQDNIKGGDIYYYKALFLFKNRKMILAIEVIDLGLLYYPGDFYLTNLKLKILSESWRTDNNLKAQTIVAFEEYLINHSNDIAAKSLLIEIYQSIDKYNDVSRLIKSCLEQYSLPYSYEDLKLHSIEIIIKYINNIDTITSYRKVNDISPYFIANFDISTNCLNNILFYLDLSFFDLFSKVDEKLREKKLFFILDKHHKFVISLSQTISSLLASEYKNALPSLEEVSEILSNFIVVLPEILLREVSGQIAFILQKKNYDISINNSYIKKSKALENWFPSTVEPILIGANTAFNVFSKE